MPSQRKDTGGTGGGERRATVARLAERFRLTKHNLEGWGVFDKPGGLVGIRYRGVDGSELFVRRRTHVSALHHTYQPTGKALAPYGMWKLHLAHARGWLLLVEGESDCWCCWKHDLPALGIPGCGAMGCLPAGIWAPEIKTVYVWQEPDEGGVEFAEPARGILRARGFVREVKIVQAPPGIKDVAELHIADPAGFESALMALLGAATSAEEPRETPPLFGRDLESGRAVEAPPEAPAAETDAPAAAEEARQASPASDAEVGRKKKTKGTSKRGGISRGAGGAEVAALAPAGPTPAGKEQRSPGPVAPPSADFVMLSDVREAPLEWLDPGWVAMGTLTLICGAPSSGKSTYGAHLAALAGRSILLPEPGEDLWRGPVQRMRANGADPGLVRVLRGDGWSFPAKRDRLLAHVKEHKARLVWIDPIDSYRGGMSMNLEEEVTPLLESLAYVAIKTGCAVVCARHPGKDAMNINPGSFRWATVPRCVLEIVVNEGPPVERYLRVHRDSCNAGQSPRRFDLLGAERQALKWAWAEDVGPDVIAMARERADPIDQIKEAEAVEWLRDVLADGALETARIYALGIKEGYGDRLLRRARRHIKPFYRKRFGSGAGAGARWSLVPIPDTPDTPDTPAETP